jgi:hypothetical protein
MPISKRVFIVGCPRSGTTVLQSRVASHPKIHTFPETFFFTQSVGLYYLPIAWLGLATGRERKTLEEIIGEREDLLRLLRKNRYWFMRTAVEDYAAVLDRLSEESGKSVWLEKTPGHLYYIGLMNRYIDRAYFIHIARRGEDVVASFYDRAGKNPERFGWETIDYAIRTWNRSLWISSLYFGKPRHCFVVYERFIANPKHTLRKIAAFLDLEYSSNMLEGDLETLKKVTPECRPWLQEVRNPVARPEDKFERSFDEEMRNKISHRLKTDIYNRFVLNASLSL